MTNPRQPCPECELLRTKLRFVEQDAAFPVEDGRFCLLLSDVFYYASADSETIPEREILPLWQLYLSYGWRGLMAWAQNKRGQQIIGKERKHVTQLQKQLEQTGRLPLARLRQDSGVE